MTKNKIHELDLSVIKQNYFKKKLQLFTDYLFRQEINIKGLLLFGSVAKGKGTITDDYVSDIDLIIISEDLPDNLWERRKKTLKLTKPVIGGIQALWWTPKEIKNHVKHKFYLILDALDDGKILYDPEGLLHRLKKQLFKDLTEKGVIKTDLYWQWPIKYFGEKIEF